jgi:hypothetical protein
MGIAQLSFDLSEPINHHAKLHSEAHGTVLYWEQRKEANRWTKIRPGDPVEKLIAGFSGGVDTYLTVNQFFGWRHIRSLTSLRACYVDIDGSNDLEEVLDALKAARLPAPSFAVYSGRGLHLYWLLEHTHAKALPRWQLVQDTLIRALASVKADPAARDALRVLRLVGTTNGKNGECVRGVILTDTVWTLDELANEVLGERQKRKPAKVYDLAATGARKGKGGRAYTGSIYDWWYLVYKDLCAIADFHWFGGVPEGHRDRVLFLMAVALSWYTQPESLHAEILATARTFTPSLDEKEVSTQMAPILKRAEMAANGQRLAFNGRDYDARYNYSAETLRESLAGIIPPALHDQLRALAPAHVIEQRKRERDAGRDRVAEGRYQQTRAAYLDNAAQKATSARLLKAQGRTAAEIAAELGISRASVFKYLKEGV